MIIGGALRIAACAGLALVDGGGLVEGAAARPAATRPAEPQVALVCTVKGLAKHHRGIAAAALCARFEQRIREALGVPVAQAGQIPAGSKGRWIKIEVRMMPLGRAEAALISRLHGKSTEHPLLAVQAMDKPLGLGEIDRLARLAGKTLAGH
jgi:hypothetical protein